MSEEITKRRPLDLFLSGAILALTLIVFWPVLRWVATQTFAHEQLKQGMWIVLFAGGWIAFEQRALLRLKLEFSRQTLVWMFVAYASAGAAVFLKSPHLVLFGLLAAAAASVHLIFGDRAFRRALPLLGAAGVFLLLILLFPILDWPLRNMAGWESARLLSSMGFGPKILLSYNAGPQIEIFQEGRRFFVATECNGFGLISSSLLLATILLIYQRAKWWMYLVAIPGCVFVSFIFNLLRIFVIITLAPKFPNHYMVLHEIAGIVALYVGLGAVWYIAGPVGKKASAGAA